MCSTQTSYIIFALFNDLNLESELILIVSHPFYYKDIWSISEGSIDVHYPVHLILWQLK